MDNTKQTWKGRGEDMRYLPFESSLQLSKLKIQIWGSVGISIYSQYWQIPDVSLMVNEGRGESNYYMTSSSGLVLMVHERRKNYDK